MLREQAIESLLDEFKDCLIISSTGKMSRELFELRKKRGEPTDDFYMMGSMGCALGIGLGVAMNTKKKVKVLTGDGALLMHLGSLATIIKQGLDNLEIIVINNGCHESTGGQKHNFEVIKDFVSKYCRVIDVEPGCRKDLGRPDITPKQMVDNFRSKL